MARPLFYILDDEGNPQPDTNTATYAMMVDKNNRRVALSEIPVAPIRVSTVFLPVDHNLDVDGPPLLFETMTFGGKHDGYQQCYSTREEALAGHARAKKMVEDSQDD